MKSNPTGKRTLWNFLSLFLGLFGVGLITAILIYLQTKFSTPLHTDVGVPPDLFAGLWIIYLAIFLGICVVLLWTIRILRDIFSFKRNRRFGLINVTFLVLAYGPLLGFGIYKTYLETNWHLQRNNITTNIESYHTIELKTNSTIFAFENKNDSLFLFLKIPDTTFPKPFYKRLFSNSGSTLESQIWLHELHVFSLQENCLSVISNPVLDTISNMHDIYLNTHLPKINCNIYSGNIEKRQLIIHNPCLNYTDTIFGFSVIYRGNSPNSGCRYFVDRDNKYWFLFYTEDRKNEPTNLFLGMTEPNHNCVYKISLREIDRKFFDSDNIITLFKMKNTFYIISRNRIIYFDVSTAARNNEA